MIEAPTVLPSAAVVRDEPIGARQSGGAQDDTHLRTKPAAGDEDQAFGHLRKLI